MAKRKVSPEGKIIALFTGLSEESQRMVMFGLNAIMSQIPKPPSPFAPPVGKRSSRKSEGTSSTVSTATDKTNAGIVLPDNPDDFEGVAV